jgi:hypothetical protein
MGGGFSQALLAIYIKRYLKAKEELWKLKIFHQYKNIIFRKKNSLKEAKILQDIITLYNRSQVSTQAKISSFKNPHIKIDLLLLPRGQNPLSYYTL